MAQEGSKVTFGSFFRARRMALGKSLRGFCIEKGLDPGNISRLERGLLSQCDSAQRQHPSHMHPSFHPLPLCRVPSFSYVSA